MQNKAKNQISSALVAALFVTMALAVIVPAPASAVDVGGGYDVTFTVGGEALTVGSTHWLNAGSGAQAFGITVARLTGTQEADTVFFGLENPNGPGDQFTISGVTDNQDGWDSETLDDNGNGNDDGVVWEGPAPSTTCNTLGIDCPEFITPGAFTATFTPVGGIVEFAPQVVKTTLFGPGGYASNDNAFFLIGYDATAPLAALTFDDGTGNTDTTLWHSEADAVPGVTFTFSDALSGIESVTFKMGGEDVASCTTTSPCTVDMADIPEGTTTFTASATDAAGNTALATDLTIKIDRTGPSFANGMVVGGVEGLEDWYTAAPTDFTLDVTDAAAGVTTFDATWTLPGGGIDSILGISAGVGVSAAPTGGFGTTGQYTLDVTADDDAHGPNTNAVAPFFDVFVDIDLPTSSITGSPMGYVGPDDLVDLAAGATLSFLCTESDVGSGVAQTLLYTALDDGVNDLSNAADYGTDGFGVVCDGVTDVDRVATVSGYHYFFTQATDVAGNDEAVSLPGDATLVQVDLTPPEAGIALGAGQGTFGIDTVVSLDVTASDDHSGLATLILQVSDDDGDTWQDIGPEPAFDLGDASPQTVTFDIADLSAPAEPDLGIYQFRVLATDAVGIETASTHVEYELIDDIHLLPLEFTNLVDDAENFFGAGDLTGGEFTITGIVEEGSDITVAIDGGALQAADVDDGSAVEGVSPWSFTFTPALDVTHNIVVDGVDFLGNPPVAPLDTEFRVDTLAPSVEPDVPTGLTVKGPLGTVTFTVTDDVGGSGPALDADDVDAPVGAVVTVDGSTYAVDLSEVGGDGSYDVTVNAKDEVGNLADPFVWTITSDDSVATPAFTSGIDGILAINNPDGDPFDVSGTLEDGWTMVSWNRAAGTSSGGATCNTTPAIGDDNDFVPMGGAATWDLTLTGLTRTDGFGCIYTLTVTAEDPFGNTQSAVLSIENLDVRTIDVAVDPADRFTRLGQSVSLTLTATDAADGSPQSSVRLNIYHTAVDPANLLGTPTTNQDGMAMLPVGTQSAFGTSGEYDIIVIPTEQNIPLVGFRPVVVGDVDDESIVFTRLAPVSLTALEPAVLRNTPATLSMPIVWEHDGSIATGLTKDCMGDANANAPCGTGHNIQLLDVNMLDGLFSETSTLGTYEATHTSPTSMEKIFKAKGSSIAFQRSAEDPATTFVIPTALEPTETVQWVGAVASIALSNLGDPLDSTPGFVNLDDTVRLDVTVTSQTDAVVSDPVVTLFDDATGTSIGTPCKDGDPCDLNPLPNVVGFNIAIGDLELAPYFTGAGRTTVHAMATSFVVLETTIVADIGTPADVADFADDVDLTFTGVTIALDPAWDLVADGGADDFANGRVWKTADDFDPPAPGVNSDSDEIVIQVLATWDHDTSVVTEDATLRIFDGMGFVLDNDELEVTATEVAPGTYQFTLDPDLLGGDPAVSLDYIVNTFDFVLLAAPEPSEPGHSDPSESIEYQDPLEVAGVEAVWTVVDLGLQFSNPFETADTFRVGEEAPPLAVVATYRLTGESNLASGPGFTLGILDAVLAEPGSGLTWVKDDPTEIATGHFAEFFVRRGCTDVSTPVDCQNTADPDEAAWHQFTATATTGIPHGLGLGETSSMDLLWTAGALHMTTDRATAAVGDEIEYTVRAYYAHGFDKAGDPLDLEDRVFPHDVVVEHAALPGGEATVTPDTPVTFTQTNLVPGALLTQVECREQAPGTCDVFETGTTDPTPIDIVVQSAELSRLWLDLAITPAFDDKDGTPESAFLATEDRLVLRGDQPTVGFTVAVLDGMGDEVVDDTYPGYSFATTDSAETRQMPDVVHDADPFVLAGQTPFTATFLEGLDGLDTSTDATFSGGVWEIPVPTAVTTDLSMGIDVDVSGLLQVTDTDGTTVGDDVVDTSPLVVTAVEIAVTGSSHPLLANGQYWSDLGTDVDLEVTATWWHNDDPVTDLSLINEALADIGDFSGPDDGMAVDDGIYTVKLESPMASAFQDFVFLADAGTAVLDDDVTTKAFGDPTGLILTVASLDVEAVFTQAVLSFLGASDEVLNTNDAAEIGLLMFWEHDMSPVTFATFEFAVDPDGPGPQTTQAGFVSGSGGDGLVVLSSSVSQTVDVPAPTALSLENGITAIVAPAAGPTLTWTQLVTTIDMGALDAAQTGTGDGSAGDPFEFDVQDLVTLTAGVTFENYDGDGDTFDDPAAGAQVFLVGAPETADLDGLASADFQSNIEQTVPMDAEGVQATLDGTDITSSTGPALVYVKWV